MVEVRAGTRARSFCKPRSSGIHHNTRTHITRKYTTNQDQLLCDHYGPDVSRKRLSRGVSGDVRIPRGVFLRAESTQMSRCIGGGPRDAVIVAVRLVWVSGAVDRVAPRKVPPAVTTL